jgi:hypothetical protein
MTERKRGPSGTLTAEDLIAKRQVRNDTREVPIGELGVIVVRGLTKAEAKRARREAIELAESLHGQPTDEQIDEQFETTLIAAAMVEPEMTVEQTTEWLDGAPAADYYAVLNVVQDLCGMTKEAAKSRVPAVRRERRR